MKSYCGDSFFQEVISQVKLTRSLGWGDLRKAIRVTETLLGNGST